MRDFFINALEKIIAVVIVLGALAVLIGGVGTIFSQGGFLRGLGILIGGSIYLMLIGGMAYLCLGIYHNTRPTAEAVEKLAQR